MDFEGQLGEEPEEALEPLLDAGAVVAFPAEGVVAGEAVVNVVGDPGQDGVVVTCAEVSEGLADLAPDDEVTDGLPRSVE